MEVVELDLEKESEFFEDELDDQQGEVVNPLEPRRTLRRNDVHVGCPKAGQPRAVCGPAQASMFEFVEGVESVASPPSGEGQHFIGAFCIFGEVVSGPAAAARMGRLLVPLAWRTTLSCNRGRSTGCSIRVRSLLRPGEPREISFRRPKRAS
jgi:hypothetical protein